MLTKLLKRETCAQCRMCCIFDASDAWEVPVLTPEEADSIRNYDASIVPCGNEWRFAVPELHGEELFTCPMLTETGCRLGEQKPFDCSVWPFRLMQDESGVHITLATLCESMAAYSVEELRRFLHEQGLAQTLFQFAASHPEHVHPMMADYRVIL